MTTRDPHATHPVDTAGDPLTFAMSGLMAEPAGTVFEYDIPAVHVELDEELATTEPVTGRMRVTRTNRGLIVDARIHTSLAGECARCLRPIVTPVDARIDEEVLPVDRPRERQARPTRGGRRPRGRPADRPLGAGAAPARRRRGEPRGADRAAVRARLPRAVPGVRRAHGARPRPRRGAHRPAARGAACLPGRRRRRERVDSAIGPTSRGGASARPGRRSQDTIDRPAGMTRPRTSRSNRPTWECRSERSLTRDRWSGGATWPSPCRTSSSVRIATR